MAVAHQSCTSAQNKYIDAALDRFLRAEEPDEKSALTFDVDTAIEVSRHMLRQHLQTVQACRVSTNGSGQQLSNSKVCLSFGWVSEKLQPSI